MIEPTWMTVPDYAFTLGPDVAEINAAAGFAPDAAQALILDHIFGFVKPGVPSAAEIVTIVPRQNLKTGLMKQAALGWMILGLKPLVIWSAHETTTSNESFKDLVDMLEGSDFLSSHVAQVYRGDGREHIRFRNGGRIIFKARTKSGSRGLSAAATILDEGFALKPLHLGSLLPTMLTKRDGQLLTGSSSGLADSDILRGLRDRGRRGDARLAYFEWSDERARQGCVIDGCDHAITREGCALDDRSRWWATNPALGSRISEESIANLRRSLPPEEFARECLGWWDEPADVLLPFDPSLWEARADYLGAAIDLDDVRLAVDMPPERSSTTIVAAGRRPDGLPQVEVVDVRPGVDWVLDRLNDMRQRRRIREITVDGAGAAASLIPALELDGFLVRVASARDMSAACGGMFDAIQHDAIRHVPHVELTAAVYGARKRTLGDAWALDRRHASVNISPLVAAVLAHWAVTRTRPRKSDAELLASLG
jgi:hypothetical protein